MNLVFLLPALLVGAAVVALPVVIHLISRRRARRVRFAAMEFVLKSQRRTARTIRLRQLLLLVVRALLVLTVALALARPLLRPTPDPVAKPTTAPLVVVAVLDASGSMSARLDRATALERARDKVKARVLELPDDVLLGLVACDDAARDVVAPPSFDRAAFLRRLDAVEPTMKAGVLAPCVERALELALLPTGEGERRILVGSDLARHAFTDGAATAARARDVVVEWIAAFDDELPWNRGFTAVGVARGGGAAATTIRFSVAQTGGIAGDVPVDLTVDDARVARASLSLGPGIATDRAFTHTFPESADDGDRAHGALLRLPDDALAADDAVPVPLEVPRPLRVIVVDGAPQPVPLRDEVYYLESALRHDRALDGRLKVDVIGPDALVPAVLADARVVVLANTAPFDDGTAAALVDFVKAGGGLLVTVGDQVDVEWMNAHLAAVLPGRLRGVKGLALLDDANVSEVLGFARFEREHPALLPLARAESGLQGLARVEIRTFMLLEPEQDAPRDVLVAYTNDAPALLERRVDAGRVMLLTTTIDRDWGDLPIRPGFLPLVQELVLHLGGALDESGPRVISAGATRTIIVPTGIDEVEITGPTGRRARLPVVALGRRRGVEVTDADRPGLYRVAFARGGGALHDVPSERFTVLFPASEGALVKADDDQLAAATPAGARRVRGGPGDDDFPLWPGLLVGALVLFLLEALLVRRAAGRAP